MLTAEILMGHRGYNYQQTVKISSILHKIKHCEKRNPHHFDFMLNEQTTFKTMTVGEKKSLWCEYLHPNWFTLCLNSEWQPGGFRRGWGGISEVLSIITTEPPPKLQPSQLPFIFSHSFFPPTVKGTPSGALQATLKCTFYSNLKW